MIITVITMRMMQVAIHKVINVIAVRNSLVSAVLAMNMSRLMPTASMLRCTYRRIGDAYLQHMLIHMITMRMMQVAIVKVIGVAVMFDCSVTTASVVLMVVFFMDLVLAGHVCSLTEKRERGQCRKIPFSPKNQR